MTFWQRWRFRAETRAIRADLDRLAQRINDLEKRITQLAHRLPHGEVNGDETPTP